MTTIFIILTAASIMFSAYVASKLTAIKFNANFEIAKEFESARTEIRNFQARLETQASQLAEKEKQRQRQLEEFMTGVNDRLTAIEMRRYAMFEPRFVTYVDDRNNGRIRIATEADTATISLRDLVELITSGNTDYLIDKPSHEIDMINQIVTEAGIDDVDELVALVRRHAGYIAQ